MDVGAVHRFLSAGRDCDPKNSMADLLRYWSGTWPYSAVPITSCERTFPRGKAPKSRPSIWC